MARAAPSGGEYSRAGGFTSPARTDSKAPMADRDSAEYSMERVGGCTLRVARWRWNEPDEAPPLLFFNGIGANIEVIAPLAEALGERRFIAYDMPGVGGSPQPVLPYTASAVAWQARAVLRRFGCDTADVMGLSWGGGMAQQFALQHPECVRRLVLAATSAGTLMVPGMPSAPGTFAELRRYVDAGYVTENFRTLFGALVGNRHEHMARLRAPSPRGYLYQLLAIAGWTSAPLLPLLRSPTLILMGEEDRVVPLANGHILAGLIPDSRLGVIGGGGHLFVLSHLDQTLARLREFLDAPDPAGRKAA